MNRLLTDITHLERNPEIQIHFTPNDDNIRHCIGLILGPIDTPYQDGFFFFDFEFPIEYPTVPPIVKFMSNNNGHTRMNPNLYANGMVCLSILGTFSGAPWSVCQNIKSLLLSIQSLLSENPYTNEPGFEVLTDSNRAKSEAYNHKIIHSTIKHTVLEQLDERWLNHGKFAGIMMMHFLERYANFVNTCKKYMHLDGKNFEIQRFESYKNQMTGKFEFASLIEKLAEKREMIHKFIYKIDDAPVAKIYDSEPFIIQFINVGPCHYQAVITGPEFTPYEGYTINIDIKMNRNFEEIAPIVKIQQHLFHPCISIDGVPFLERKFSAAITYVKQIYQLLQKNTFHPYEILNKEAYFDFQNQKSWKRAVRRMMEEGISNE